VLETEAERQVAEEAEIRRAERLRKRATGRSPVLS
jgi:hypothetical protein